MRRLKKSIKQIICRQNKPNDKLKHKYNKSTYKSKDKSTHKQLPRKCIQPDDKRMNEKYTLANKVHENMTTKLHMTTAESTQYELLPNYT